jgi:hypothetical protein
MVSSVGQIAPERLRWYVIPNQEFTVHGTGGGGTFPVFCFYGGL